MLTARPAGARPPPLSWTVVLGVWLVATGCGEDRVEKVLDDGDRTIRFAVIGDSGDASDRQFAVAAAMRDVCAREGCDFIVTTGDNIYDSGVQGVDDPQWETKFEAPYRDLRVPFHPVMGNHDYGGELLGRDIPGLGNEFYKGEINVEYTAYSERWRMPATHYALVRDHVGFLFLDTVSAMFDDRENGDQREWYPDALEELGDAEWVIAVGHHPVRSNGLHGNVGRYDTIEVGDREIPNPIPLLDGRNLVPFFDEVVCGTVDLYFAGHDHNLQWLDEPEALCGAELIVSGAGGRLDVFEAPERNEVFFQHDASGGFMHVVIEGDTFTGRFYDQNAELLFERSVTRPGPRVRI
jgi:tartrate-resistant acid phosphatase type 5